MKRLLRQTLQNQFQYSFGRSSNNSKTIGFIGLGNMGGPMALNLKTKGGYDVIGYDAIPEKRKEYAGKGIGIAHDIETIAKNTEIVVTMLRNHHDVQSVCYGEKGLFKLLPRSGIIMDCSTISPKSAKEIHQVAKQSNIAFVDSPVSGGVGAATQGTLAFMVGTTNKQHFERANEVLKHMGKAVIHCEGEGSGQIAKACNNMALSVEMIAVSEAIGMGAKLGLDPKVLSQIMSISSSSCWSVNLYNPCPGVNPNVPSSKNYEGGFASELMLKDLNIAYDAAKDCGASIALGSKAKEIYEKIVSSGLNRKDFSIVYDQIYNNKL